MLKLTKTYDNFFFLFLICFIENFGIIYFLCNRRTFLGIRSRKTILLRFACIICMKIEAVLRLQFVWKLDIYTVMLIERSKWPSGCEVVNKLLWGSINTKITDNVLCILCLQKDNNLMLRGYHDHLKTNV
jgi:hypothetical protein